MPLLVTLLQSTRALTDSWCNMSIYIPNTTNNTAITSTAYTGSATQVITVMCWFQLPTAGTPATYRDIVALDPNIYFQTFSDGATIDYGTSTADHTGQLLMSGVWYHASMVVIPSSTTNRQILGYFNGQLTTNVTDTTTFSAYTNICIGNSITYGYANPLAGNVRDVRIWTRQLSITEIQSEISSKVPLHTQALLLWAPLDDNTYTDKSGNGYTFTVGSAVTLQGGMAAASPTYVKSNTMRIW
jgi:hypothetical protein